MARDLAVGPRRAAGDYHADLNRISSSGRGRPDRFHPGPTSLAGPAWTLLHGGELQLKLQLWRPSCHRWVMSSATLVSAVSGRLLVSNWPGHTGRPKSHQARGVSTVPPCLVMSRLQVRLQAGRWSGCQVSP